MVNIFNKQSNEGNQSQSRNNQKKTEVLGARSMAIVPLASRRWLCKGARR